MPNRKVQKFYQVILWSIVFMAGLLLFTPALADEEGPATGQFGSSAAPEISALAISQAGGVNIPSALTPVQEYDLAVTVTDADGIGQLESLTLKLWYDSTGASFTPEAFNTLGGISDAQTMLVLTWTRADNAVIAPANGTWQAYGMSLPSQDQLADPAYTSHTFYFRVKIGKVARETTGAGKWQVAASVSDSVPYTGYAYFQTGGQAGLPMNWYGEINLAGSDFIDWGYIANGLRFGDPGSKAGLTTSGSGVWFLSNGDFQQLLKSSVQWTKVGNAAQIIQLSAGATEENTFALRASRQNLEDPSDAIALAADGSYTVIDATGQTTGESGLFEKNYFLWLALSPDVGANGIYQSQITFSIANR
jgi:hypothetical protein